MVRVGHQQTLVDSLDQLLQERDPILDDLQFNVAMAQQRMEFYADKKRREVVFEVGDFVYLKMRPYHQKSLASRMNEKFGPRFYGPYKILQRVGKAAYQLELPKDCSLHPVFHVSQLKRAEGVTQAAVAVPPLTADLEEVLQPVDILQIRHLPSKPREILVLWDGRDETEATWEDTSKFFATFPFAHLEDKVLNLAGSIVTPTVPRVLKTYQRRKKTEGLAG